MTLAVRSTATHSFPNSDLGGRTDVHDLRLTARSITPSHRHAAPLSQGRRVGRHVATRTHKAHGR
ncbi:hypothetical protein E2C01_046984 [Portunus trituberculatus]|uniref:Uncharacterized protein n=1 Tax=Portunus trituberculatus TaxID=210409 RepID=A0A5B7G684_PORTR|nr:hypothetical protein [Portunus trituberculatus]